jgi:hypothetical protein
VTSAIHRKLFRLNRVQALAQGRLIRLSAGFVFFLPCRQRPIKSEACNTAGPSEVKGLFLCRVELDFMDAMHGLFFRGFL